MAKKFSSRPTTIEAEQWDGVNDVNGVCKSRKCYGSLSMAGSLLTGFDVAFGTPHVHTMHSNHIVLLQKGDWIVAEPDGEHFYPVKPDVFANKYEFGNSARDAAIGELVKAAELVPVQLEMLILIIENHKEKIGLNGREALFGMTRMLAEDLKKKIAAVQHG